MKRFAFGLITIAAALGLASPATAGPHLLFDKDDLPRLREAFQRPPLERDWQPMLNQSRAFCDPQADAYLPASRQEGDLPYSGGDAHLLVGRDLSKWMEHIGLAYQITGDEELGEHGAAILARTVKEYPLSNPMMSRSFSGGRGDMLRGMALGFDWLNSAMTESQREAVAEAAAAYIERVLESARNPRTWWFRYHNFNGVSVGAAGMMALALKDVYPERSRAWTDECAYLIKRWLDESFDEHGAYTEGVAYANYGLSNAAPFMVALRRNGGRDLLSHPHLVATSRFYIMTMLPGETVSDARNDSHYYGPRITPLLLAAYNGDGLARWLSEHTGRKGNTAMTLLAYPDAEHVEPTGPRVSGLPLAEFFPDRGLAVWRTGWDASDVMFSVEAGPYFEVIHDQADEGHFTLYGLGHRWAIDTGYANTYDMDGRAQTLAHSCVLVNGKGQARSGAGLGTEGKTVAYENNGAYGYAQMDTTLAYRQNVRNHLGDRADALADGMEMQRALRHVLFIRPGRGAPAYAVVLDDIEKDGEPHDYTWQMFTGQDMTIDTTEQGWVLRPGVASGRSFLGTPTSAQGQGDATWTLRVPKSGNYVLWARVQALDAGTNSFYVRWNDGPERPWNFGVSRSWHWQAFEKPGADGPTVVRLEEGTQTLRFRRREAGAKVDALAITRDQRWTPQGASPTPPGGLFVEAEDATIAAPMRRFTDADETPRMLIALSAESEVRTEHERKRFTDAGGLDCKRVRGLARATNPYFAAVLAPLTPQNEDPDITFTRRDDACSIEIVWRGRRDEVVWPLAPGSRPRLKTSPVSR